MKNDNTEFCVSCSWYRKPIAGDKLKYGSCSYPYETQESRVNGKSSSSRCALEERTNGKICGPGGYMYNVEAPDPVPSCINCRHFGGEPDNMCMMPVKDAAWKVTGVASPANRSALLFRYGNTIVHGMYPCGKAGQYFAPKEEDQ
jgi:hypothetical protein